MLDLAITGGTCVLPTGTQAADIGVKDGRIVLIGSAGALPEAVRTVPSVKAWPLCALAGFCKNAPESGPVFAAMTTESSAVVAPLNPRMAVLIGPDEYERWLEGSIEDVIDFQFRDPFPSEKLAVDATKDLWVPRSERAARQDALL